MNPTNRTTKEDIEKWLKPILQKENLKNYNITISGNSEKGDGYLGDITFVEVNGHKNGEEKTYHLVVKSGKKSEQLRKQLPIKCAFENEIHFYTTVLPTYLKFQAEKRIAEPFDNVPRYYGTAVFEDIEVLVLENLKKKSFCLYDRTRPMDKNHIRTIVKKYGKLHALSFALRDQKPEVFKKLCEKLVDVMSMMEVQEDNIIYKDFIDIANDKKEFEIAEKGLILQKVVSRIGDLTDPQDPFAVIIHGDCWNNNFMFKYKENLLDVRFLDFQLSFLASPVYDLSYFLFTCVSPEDVVNFDEIINVYYESFSNFLRQLGSDPDKLFPFEELINQWKKYGIYGLFMMPSLIRICLSDKEEVVDLQETAEAGIDIIDAFSYAVKDVEEYARRNFSVMKFAINRGFI